MKRHNFAAGLALAVLAVLGLTGPVIGGEQVPFKGNLEGDVTVTPVDPPFIVDVLVESSGNATQLGEFMLDIPHRVNRGDRTARGTYEFTAANGDLLSADFEGVSMLIAPDVLYIVEIATISPTDSTGRFAGATGSFTCERLFDMASGTTIGTFDGTISRPGR